MASPPTAKQIFNDALERAAGDRAAFIAQCCNGNAALRSRVEELLAAHASAGAFLASEAPCARVLERLQEHPGMHLGPYRLIELLGEGGFGAVFLAEQESPIRRRVAVKIIKLGMDTRQVIARFEAERQTLAMMDHPNIARVFDAGATETGRPYFVMELVSGVPITRHCDDNHLSIRERLELVVDVCRAVQHAHAKGVIHRDLKPSNVLVARHDERPVVKVIDFGIAKAIHGRDSEWTHHTGFRQFVGTPAYMSPEQAGLWDSDIDTRSDVYSLGVMLYELLTGRAPFDLPENGARDQHEYQRLIREVEPSRPSDQFSSLLTFRPRQKAESDGASGARDASSECNPETIALRRQIEPAALGRMLRGDLDWIVMKCLEKDRARRYATPNELASDIARHLAGEPILAAPPSRAYRVRKFVRRHRGEVVSGALVVLSLLAATVGTTTFALREARQRAVAERNAEETARIAEFNGDMLASINPRQMGEHLREDLLAEAERGWKRAGRSRDEIETSKAKLDAFLRDANLTNVSIQTLDRTLFETTYQTIDRDFAEQPHLQAQLFQNLATTLIALNLVNQAIGPQSRALELRMQQLGEEHAETLDSIASMVLLMDLLGRYGDALTWAETGYRASIRVYGPDSPAGLDAERLYGYALFRRGTFLEAEQHLRGALEGYRRELGDEDRATLHCMRYLGITLIRRGHVDAAAALLEETLATAHRALDADDPETLSATGAMALLRQAQGRYAEAEALMREALAGRRRVLGDAHRDTVFSLDRLGQLLLQQLRYEEAEPYFRESLEILRRCYGDDHPWTCLASDMVGTILMRQGRYEEAESFLVAGVEGARRFWGSDCYELLWPVMHLGILRRFQGRLDEADGLLTEAVELRGRLKLGRSRDAALLDSEIGLLREAQQRLPEAAACYRDAVSGFTQYRGPDHPETRAAAAQLAAVLERLGAADELSPLRSQGLVPAADAP
ncbi:MAG: hypothetical protein AMXMBFR47_20040 [Planctomycetota bacterium]